MLNFSDGEPTTALEPAADALRRLNSSNGAALVFNAHLSENDREPLLFHSSEDVLPAGDKLARRMFRLSSVLPDILVQRARGRSAGGARGAGLRLQRRPGRRFAAAGGGHEQVSRPARGPAARHSGRLKSAVPFDLE